MISSSSRIALTLVEGWDKGAADLIASGDIKVKTRVSPVSYTSGGVIFSDNVELPADAIIFA